jgi:hypothetical protein
LAQLKTEAKTNDISWNLHQSESMQWTWNQIAKGAEVWF